jgi:hypothetical protein
MGTQVNEAPPLTAVAVPVNDGTRVSIHPNGVVIFLDPEGTHDPDGRVDPDSAGVSIAPEAAQRIINWIKSRRG